MGRYIGGDVDGKCWFGVQDSDFMDRFGVSYSEPDYISYHYDSEDLEEMEKELDSIKTSMGEQFEKYEDFFKKGRGYNQEILRENDLDPKHLSDYADYSFAIKVRDYIKEHDSCSFEVEC